MWQLSPSRPIDGSKDGQPLPGETATSLKLQAAMAASAGAYTVTVTNGVGSVTSRMTRVTVGATGPATLAGAAAPGGAGGAGGQTTTRQGGAGAGSQTASAGASHTAQMGSADHSGSSSPLPTGGTDPVKAAGAVASSNTAPTPAERSGGCNVGASHAASGAWFWLVATLLTLRRKRPRRATRAARDRGRWTD
jgi:hypothetical protein